MWKLEPSDEYMHPVEEAKNFNESMYFNVFDAEKKVGGFFRIGNRPNEGYAETTICLYLPDGSVAFMFNRPKIVGNEAFDAGGMKFEALEPFKKLSITYDGKVLLLSNPLEMNNPKKAFAENPYLDCSVRLEYIGLSPMFGGEPMEEKKLSEHAEMVNFARRHYEQHVAGKGDIRIGDRSWQIDGFGVRDHSWGPRYWQSIWYYRWMTANFGADFGFMISLIAMRDGTKVRSGMVFTEGRYDLIKDNDIQTEWMGEDRYHKRLLITARTANDTYEIDGNVLSLLPLRNQRVSPEGETLATRISEGMTEWKCRGKVGYGLSEYLDQLVDGKAVGATS
ncbi:MAG: hypothetical protein HPY65_00590 [Syntrophaceae bacterium]|nr:hypothetical protein [Syntrophaceae bacterium]